MSNNNWCVNQQSFLALKRMQHQAQWGERLPQDSWSASNSFLHGSKLYWDIPINVLHQCRSGHWENWDYSRWTAAQIGPVAQREKNKTSERHERWGREWERETCLWRWAQWSRLHGPLCFFVAVDSFSVRLHPCAFRLCVFVSLSVFKHRGSSGLTPTCLREE